MKILKMQRCYCKSSYCRCQGGNSVTILEPIITPYMQVKWSISRLSFNFESNFIHNKFDCSQQSYQDSRDISRTIVGWNREQFFQINPSTMEWVPDIQLIHIVQLMVERLQLSSRQSNHMDHAWTEGHIFNLLKH